MEIVLKTKRMLWLPVLLLLIFFRIGSERPRQVYKASSNDAVQQQVTGSRTSTSRNDKQRTSSAPLLNGIPTATINRKKEKLNLCSNEEMVQGKWIPVTLKRPPYVPLSPRVRCLRPEAFSKPFPTFIWQPHNHLCQIMPWNPYLLGQYLHNQTIAFIGDSLTLEHYASLVHMLGDRARLPPKAVRHGRIQRHICVADSNNNNTKPAVCMNVVFKTDFFLENITAEVAMSFPRVMVLNRGAHYKPDKELLTSLDDYTLPALQEWNQKCQQSNNPKCLLIWRTTVPGHPQCHQFTHPSESVEEMERWILDKSTNDTTQYRKGEYHWQDFQRQNVLIQDILLQKWQPLLSHVTIKIMDSYRINILRPDNHRSHFNDCLHSCSPGGGSDLNSQWLLHILEQQQQQQEQRL